MLLFAISLAFFWILNLVETFPPKEFKIPFKQRLDTCIKLENSNTKECLSFISTYQWLYDEIHIVFDKILEKEKSIVRSHAKNILEARLIHLIESPNFDLMSLGPNPLSRAIIRNHESLAITIWPQLKLFKNDSTDLQLQACRNNMDDIMEGKMLQLLTNMVTDRPDCLHQVTDPFQIALSRGFGMPMAIFLHDHGAQIGIHEISYFNSLGSRDCFEWAIRKNTSFLLESISGDYSESLSCTIWEVMKRGNHSNLLLQTCYNVIIHVVNSNSLSLLNRMVSDFPECISSKGDILMDIAIRGGMNRASIIPFLNERGVEITPAHILKDPIKRPEAKEYRDMILFLNDNGMKVTPEHLQILSTYEDSSIYEWVRLNSQLSRETFMHSPIKNDYFVRAIQRFHYFHIQKILEFNAFEIEEIERFIYLARSGNTRLLRDYVRGKRVNRCNETIFHAVNSNLHFLVKAIHKEFPECIHLKGDILMDIAVRGGMNKESMLIFLKERGVEITPGLVLSDSIKSSASGYRDMILFLNDIGVKITPEHLQHLSTYEDTSTFEWARLHSQLSKETFQNSPIKNDYFEKAIFYKRFDLTKKILDLNASDIKDIERLSTDWNNNCTNLLRNHVISKRLKNCNETIFYAVNSNLIYLVDAIHKQFPECVLSKGDILMEIAVRGGVDKDGMKTLLSERGVDITPGLVLDDNRRPCNFEYQEMILFLNDIGVEITPWHLQQLPTPSYYNTFHWASLHSQLSKESFLKSPIQRKFFDKALQTDRFDQVKKILDFNVYDIGEIERIISHNYLSEDCLNILKCYVTGKKAENCTP